MCGARLIAVVLSGQDIPAGGETFRELVSAAGVEALAPFGWVSPSAYRLAYARTYGYHSSAQETADFFGMEPECH